MNILLGPYPMPRRQRRMRKLRRQGARLLFSATLFVASAGLCLFAGLR